MNLDGKTSSITETGIITALMTLFVIAGIYIMPIIFILYPIPFVILGIRHGLKFNIISIVASSLLVSMLVDFITGFFIFFLFGLLSIVLVYLIRNRFKPFQTITISGATSLVSIVLIVTITGYITGVSFIGEIESTFAEVLRIQVDTLKNMGLTNYEMAQITDVLKATIDYIIVIIPATLIIFSIFMAYINYWLSGAILRRLGYSKFEVPVFSRFRLPSNIILGNIVIFIATAIISYLKLFYYEAIFINVTILVSTIFFIQGLAVIVYFLEKIKARKITKVILIVLILINVPLSFILSIFGLLDVIFDFRKLKSA